MSLKTEAASLTTCLLPVCIVGPNGVGKSTLLLLLTGKLTPVSPKARRERRGPSIHPCRLIEVCTAEGCTLTPE